MWSSYVLNELYANKCTIYLGVSMIISVNSIFLPQPWIHGCIRLSELEVVKFGRVGVLVTG